MPSYVRGRENGRLLSDAEMVEAYAAGETSEMIAHRAACCSVTVLKILRDAGVEIRPPGSAPTPRPRKLTDAEIIRRYREGQSGPTIADAAGCTAGTIYRILRSFNVPIRPPPNPNGGRKKTYAP